MVALDEAVKINSLVAGCNDIIDGKFILAEYKIANILKILADSKELCGLITNCLNGFDFEREFSRAQLRSASKPNKFVLPTEKEKILAFVVSVLLNINTKRINFDGFLKEFYKSETGNHAEEYTNFAKAVIVPFRDIIVEHFEISEAKKLDELKQENKKGEEDMEEVEKNLENKEQQEPTYAEETAERVENYLDEIEDICYQIIDELNYTNKIKEDTKDTIAYLAKAIINDCELNDLPNVSALITAFEFVAQSQKVKSIKLLSKELKRILIDFYDED